MTQHILVVDDSRTVCRIVELLLAPSGHALTLTHDADAARSACGTGVDLAVVDMSLPEVDALALARDLRVRAGGELPVILLGSHRNTVTPSDLEQLGNAALISKPFGADAFLDCIASTLAAPRLASPAGIAESVTKIDTSALKSAAAAQQPERESSAPAPRQSSVPAGAATDMPTSMPDAAFQVPRVPPLNLTGVSTPRQSHSPPTLDASPDVNAASELRAPKAPPAPLPSRPQGFGSVGGTAAKSVQVPSPQKPPAPAESAGVIATAAPSVSASAAGEDALGSALDALELSAKQRAGVEALITRVTQDVVWEVVPELAESLIREEITRLTAES